MNVFESNSTRDAERYDEAPPNADLEPTIGDRGSRLNGAERRAYQRGRRDERALMRDSRDHKPRRRGSPFFGAIGWLATGLCVLFAALAIHEGSFGQAGQVIDQNISGAFAPAMQTTKTAMARAGQAMQDAGDRLKQSAAG